MITNRNHQNRPIYRKNHDKSLPPYICDSIYVKQLQNENGTHVLEYYGYPVKYESQDGKYKDISLVPVKDENGFRTNDHFIGVHFPERIEEGILLSAYDNEIKSVPVEIKTAESSNSKVVPLISETAVLTENNSILYKVGPTVFYEYSITYTGYKENIILSEFTGQTDFYFLLETDGLRLKMDCTAGPDYSSEILLSNEKECVFATLGEIIVYSADSRNNTYGNISSVVLKENQEYLIKISVSEEYLSSPETLYPLCIDPTISIVYDQDSSATWNDIEDITLNQNASSDSPASGTLYVGKAGQDYGAMRSVIRFPDLDLFGINPNRITSATLYFRDLMCYSYPLQIDLYGYDGLLPTGAFSVDNMTWDGVNASVRYYEDSDAYRDSQTICYNNGYVNNHIYGYNILHIVKNWAEGRHNGTIAKWEQAVVLKATDSYEASTEQHYVCFGSYNRAVNKPYLVITYIEEDPITVIPSSAKVAVGEELALSVLNVPNDANISWSSSDESIAEITQDGVLTGIETGRVTITVEYGSNSYLCNIEIIPVSEGVYRIYNWSSLESMKVDCYGITNFTNVSCFNNVLYDFDNTKEKNELWLLTHLSGDLYTIRPIHKPNMALDYSSGNVVIYGIGIDYNFSLDSTKWKISPSSNGGGYVIQNNSLSSRTLAWDSSNHNCITINGYSGSPSERWGMLKLTEEETESLEGIIVYGSSAVKIGTSIQLTAGVFSMSSLNQQVVYFTENLTGTITSNGRVTGVSSGKMTIGVTSTESPAIRGIADVFIVSDDRQAATLIGIPSELGGTHDHTSYFAHAITILQSIYGSDSAIQTYTNIDDVDSAVGYIANSDVLIYRGHGYPGSIIFGDDSLYSPMMSIASFGVGQMRIFNESDLIIYCCCLCGAGGIDSNNLVVSTYKEGAKNVIGFKTEIDCNEANRWLNAFLNALLRNGQINQHTIIETLWETNMTHTWESFGANDVLFVFS